KEYSQQLSEARIERGRRFSMPVAVFLFALLGMPLGIQAPRAQKTWGTSLSVALGMVVFVVYFALMSVGVALAENGALNPNIAVSLPNIVVGILTLIALREMSKERWQSITEPVEAILVGLTQRFSRQGRSA
ncbi:MAG: LptF/LptG family permease, partial [Bdellovibrionales bacterium]|nr:LptF/LptG family permease [Bdellovibrionales bacterium]